MPLLLTAREDVLGSGCLEADIAGLLPSAVANAPAVEVARYPIQLGPAHLAKQACALGELFSVAGCCDDGRILFRGDPRRVHRIAAGMTVGVIETEGDVGRHAGEAMQGGRLNIGGSAGDWLASSIRGGVVHLLGSAGDHAAAALPRCDQGVNGGTVLTGGTVLIEGSVGLLAGSRMRRGMLAIGGDCGEAAAYQLRAGTVVVAGRVGRRAGAGMRRGSLVALGPSPDIWPAFARGTVWNAPVVWMMLKWLASQGWKSAAASVRGPWQQWHGDLTTGGKGELFCRV